VTTTTITIEQLEALAAQAENDNAAECERLLRLCRAMARILAVRQPEVFKRRATSITDEAGHYDNSYPPKAELHYGHAAPRLAIVQRHATEDVPTSGGYYHTWRRQTDDLGCYVAPDGSFWGCDETGTGAVGQYAAHPGDHDRDITRDWQRIEPRAKEAEALRGLRAPRRREARPRAHGLPHARGRVCCTQQTAPCEPREEEGPAMKPLTWLRGLQADGWPAPRFGPMPKLAALTGQDKLALEAIAACWQLYAAGDDDGRDGALAAVHALLPALQPQCRPFARELIAWAMDWPDRDRLWPLVNEACR
jgi:hypothetical protein